MKRNPLCLLVAFLLIAVFPGLQAAPQVWTQMYGVNISAGESGQQNPANIPGTYGTNYVYPTLQDMNYYKAKGLTFIRVPFLWERVQRDMNSTVLDQGDMDKLDQVIGWAAANGMKVLLDMHNYNKRVVSGTSYVIGSTQVPQAKYVAVWGMLADYYKNNTTVYGYDIMNEPGSTTLADWQTSAQSVANMIRTKDVNHFIFVEGLNSSGAQSWTTYNNTLNITDSLNMIVYSAHSYWNSNHDGIYKLAEQGSPMTGPAQVSNFVTWMAGRPNAHGHIGEFGVPKSGNNYLPTWLAALDGFLSYAKANNLCTTYWSGGAWLGGDTLSVHPSSNYTVDAPQMAVLAKYNNNGGPLPLPLNWVHQDVGSVAAVGSAIHLNGLYTVKGSGANIYGTADACHYAGLPVSGDCTIVARIVSESSNNGSSRAGVMIRESMAAGSANAMMTRGTSGSGQCQYRTATNGVTTLGTSVAMALPYWVAVERIGNTFNMYQSANGTTWTLNGTTTIAMGASAFAGFAVSSHSDGNLCTMTYDNVAISLGSLPSGWDNQDIGTVIPPGTSKAVSGTYTVTGSGDYIGANSDSFQFAYKPVTGNCTITARLVSQSNSHDGARAGVMLRETTAAGSSNAYLCTLPGSGGQICGQFRITTGAATSTVTPTAVTWPYWLRVVRVGNVFTTYKSPDGATWTQVGTPVTSTMAATVNAGLAVSSHNNSQLSTGVFDNVSITTP